MDIVKFFLSALPILTVFFIFGLVVAVPEIILASLMVLVLWAVLCGFVWVVER